ncbi:hypothetical protein, partial [Segatella copri]|uniref:hypothetical protein n=1 Tax=Segatella copri TaxID=165179 RepID=UPI002FEE800B
REVKLTCADGTAMQCGRVGSRLLSISEASITKVVGAFLFFPQFCFLIAQLFPTAPPSSFTFLPFYLFTFYGFFYLFTLLLFYLYIFFSQKLW